jgi:hypothetical protein
MSHYPILLGALIKIYDDMEDMKLVHQPVILSSLQSLIVLLFALTSFQDFYFAFSCFILCLFQIGFDHPFWKSLIPVTAVMFLINIPNSGNNTILKMILCIAAIAVFAVLAMVEEKLFQEEVSLQKIIFRTFLLFCFGVGFWLYFMYSDMLPTSLLPLISKTLLILIAYLAVSVGNMSYQLFYSSNLRTDTTGVETASFFTALMGRLRGVATDA